MTKRYWGMMIPFTILIFALMMIAPVQVDAHSTFGSNWAANFYSNTSFSGTAVSSSYPAGLNFNWAGIPTQADNFTPVPGFALSDNFSVRFTSSELFESRVYRFFGTADDQVKIYVDGISIFTAGVPGSFDFTYSMTAGTHVLQVDLVELSSSAVLQFQWQPSDGTVVTTPIAAATEVPPAMGHVVTVSGLSLRTGPYLGASLISVLRPNIAYPVFGKSNDEGGWYTWYLVTAGEKTGWTSGRYLIVEGADVPEMGNIFQEIDGAPLVNAFAIPRAYMNLRVRPSVRSAAIGQVPWGDTVPLVGRTLQSGIHHWLQVHYDGKIGWIYAPFVTLDGNINAVPIR